MSHITIIINRIATPATTRQAEPEFAYRYEMPVPHSATPAQVGEMVRKALKRLEGNAED